MFRLPFKVYGAVITLKKSNVIKYFLYIIFYNITKKIFLKFEIFYENHTPHAVLSSEG